jgi:hypothetical protein
VPCNGLSDAAIVVTVGDVAAEGIGPAPEAGSTGRVAGSGDMLAIGVGSVASEYVVG